MSDATADQGVRREDGRPLLKDRYAVDRELGRGGMSVVYLAYDRMLLNKQVIVKVLRSEQKENEWLRKKLMQEMEALARIDHPGVVGILDHGELPNGSHYLVMQYVEGDTLRGAITDGGMELPRVAALVKQIGQALQAAHEKGVWHRDLKPENIMLQKLTGGAEQAKLIDFGIAGIQDSVFAGSKTNVAGSLSYMAPEQFTGSPSAASDIWAMGVVAHEMLTGSKPFSDESMAHLASADSCVPAAATQRRPELPRLVDVALRRALAFQPEARHSSAISFAEELAEALEGKAARPSPPPTQPVSKKAPAWPWAAGATAICLAAVAGVWLTSGKPPEAPQIPPPPPPKLELNYSLIVQRTRDGKDSGDPIRLAGETLFEHGYKIALEFMAAKPGHLYVFNDAGTTSTGGGRTIVQLHPMAAAHSLVNPGERARIPRENWFRFDNTAGIEYLNLVWSERPLAELDSLASGADRQGPLLIFDQPPQLKQLSFFLQNNRVPVEVRRNMEFQRTELVASGDPLIHRIALEHR